MDENKILLEINNIKSLVEPLLFLGKGFDEQSINVTDVVLRPDYFSDQQMINALMLEQIRQSSHRLFAQALSKSNFKISPSYDYVLSLCCILLRDYEKAKVHLDNYLLSVDLSPINIDKQCTSLLSIVATISLKQKSYQNAINFYIKALSSVNFDQRPFSAIINLLLLAESYFYQNDIPKAIYSRDLAKMYLFLGEKCQHFSCLEQSNYRVDVYTFLEVGRKFNLEILNLTIPYAELTEEQMQGSWEKTKLMYVNFPKTSWEYLCHESQRLSVLLNFPSKESIGIA